MKNLTNPNWSSLNKGLDFEEEIKVDPNKILLSKSKIDSIDERSTITYCNEYFCEVSGYKEWELVGSPHGVLRHPDMPEIIFRLIKSRLVNKDPIIALVKNRTKSGNYYWVQLQFEIQEDQKGKIIGYKSIRKFAPESAINVISKLYEKLVLIEKTNGINASEGYLIGYLDALNTMYDTFIEDLLNSNKKTQIKTPVKNNKIKLVSGFLSIF